MISPRKTGYGGKAKTKPKKTTMHLTKTLHPPGGATALIAVIGGDAVHQLGYLYVLVPAGLGAVVMLIIALLVNNIPQNRRYPEFW